MEKFKLNMSGWIASIIPLKPGVLRPFPDSVLFLSSSRRWPPVSGHLQKVAFLLQNARLTLANTSVTCANRCKTTVSCTFLHSTSPRPSISLSVGSPFTARLCPCITKNFPRAAKTSGSSFHKRRLDAMHTFIINTVTDYSTMISRPAKSPP